MTLDRWTSGVGARKEIAKQRAEAPCLSRSITIDQEAQIRRTRSWRKGCRQPGRRPAAERHDGPAVRRAGTRFPLDGRRPRLRSRAKLDWHGTPVPSVQALVRRGGSRMLLLLHASERRMDVSCRRSGERRPQMLRLFEREQAPVTERPGPVRDPGSARAVVSVVPGQGPVTLSDVALLCLSHHPRPLERRRRQGTQQDRDATAGRVGKRWVMMGLKRRNRGRSKTPCFGLGLTLLTRPRPGRQAVRQAGQALPRALPGLFGASTTSLVFLPLTHECVSVNLAGGWCSRASRCSVTRVFFVRRGRRTWRTDEGLTSTTDDKETEDRRDRGAESTSGVKRFA